MCTSHHSETYSCEGEPTTHSIGKAAEERANKANKSPVAAKVEDYFLPALRRRGCQAFSPQQRSYS